MSKELETLERLLHHYQSLMQEWSIKNEEPGSYMVEGVEFGFLQEVRALKAAIRSLKQHGMPKSEADELMESLVRVDPNPPG